jgi:3-phosphoshikimate 1-carboxyvinyltransferase
LFVGNSGTTIRFLTPLVALAQGTFRLDGVPRMRQRPIGDLLAALQRLGVAAVSETGNDCPPVVVRASGLPGGHTEVSGSISSQFLSGLLLAAPYANRAVELTVTGPLVSQPYVAMTLAVTRAFGVDVAAADDLLHFCVPQATYRGIQYAIEPDASAASYFFAAAAITRGKLTVPGLSLSGSLQGDVAFAQVLEQMGCTVTSTADGITVSGENLPGGELRGIEVDMNAISDTVQTLGAVALFARGTTTIRGVAHIRHKETDRIGALATELRKCGATVDELADGLRITPASLHGAEIDTYDDHRMAMSLALIGLRVPGIVIRDPGCTSKTYPEFFTDLAGLY